MNRTILLVTLEFPPCRSAGLQRPYRFAQYLQEMGWNPIILTAESSLYENYDFELQVPELLKKNVFRSRAWNTTKLFSIKGKFPSIVTVPDRYWPWYFTAVKLGKQLINDYKPSCIWSTYPALTSHLVARTLKNYHQIPWIADFRDPLQCHYDPNDQNYRFLMRFIERKVVESADSICTVTEEAAQLYRKIYSNQPERKFSVIENGFVPFSNVQSSNNSKFILLYSGALYGGVRDVTGIFRAIGLLKLQGKLNSENFVLRFRGSGDQNRHLNSIKNAQIEDLIEFCPSVPFEKSIEEMHSSNANLLIQDTVFKYQIPGKLYDYIQAKQPILAICPPNSATSNRCKHIPNSIQAWTDSEIYQALSSLISENSLPKLSDVSIASFSRRARTVELADLAEKLINDGNNE